MKYHSELKDLSDLEELRKIRDRAKGVALTASPTKAACSEVRDQRESGQAAEKDTSTLRSV